MAFGDIGGTVTELIITCRTPIMGEVKIEKGDAVKLCGNYTITNEYEEGDTLFGEAMAAATKNNVGIPIKVRGISIFKYTGKPPVVDGISGVTLSSERGKVALSRGVIEKGINVKVDTELSQVHVLI